jgi:hypothetical protein
LISGHETGNPGGGFSHCLSQSLAIGAPGALQQVERMIAAVDHKKLDPFAETSAKRF